MKITPLDIQQQQFRMRFRGFDMVEVDNFLELLAGEFEELLKESNQLKEEDRRKLARISELEAVEKDLRETLVSVQRITDEMKNNARKEAELIIEEGKTEGRKIVQNAQAEARRGPDRIDGTPQAELPAELVAPGDVHVTTKRVMDSFHGTDLDTLIGRVFKADTVVLTGINTDTCVLATTFAAGNRGYRPVVISDCVASMRGLDQHWMALEIMSRSIAWVLTVDEFEAKVRGAGALDRTAVR